MTSYDEDPEHAGLLGDICGDGEPTGARHENGPDASQVIGATIQKVALGGATKANLSTDSAQKASPNASVLAEITGLASATSLSKRITLGADGELVKDPPRHFGVGKAHRLRAGTAKELAARINKCRSTQAFLYGRLKEGIVDPADVTVKGNEADGAISRSKDFFEFANGPGWVPVDIDHGGAAALTSLYAVVPELEVTARVVRASTSSGIYNADTFEQFEASLGLHASFLLADQSDAPRFLDDLFKHLWLKGHGRIELGAAGTMLERSPVDLAMKNPVQPIFEGAPELGPGLLQMPRPAVAFDGEPLDSRAAVPPLTKIEEKEYAERVRAAKAEKSAEAECKRGKWVEARVEGLVRKGVSVERACAAAEQVADGGLLPPEFQLTFDRFGIVTVADILDDPKAYFLQTLADPIEGVAYGRGKAKLYRTEGKLWINSFAHGGVTYELEGRVAAEDVFDLSAEQIADLAEKEREWVENAERIQAEKAAAAKPSANPGGGVDFRDVRVKRAPYVTKGWLHRGETVQWFGPPGAGKSASLLSVMLASAAAPPEGAMLAGCRVKHGLAIFAAYERAGETQDRLAAARERLGLPDDLPFVLLTAPPILKDGKSADAMIEVIRHYEKQHGRPCSIFAIDTLTAARPGMGQSDDGDMSLLMNHLQHIRDVVGCCLVFIHHPTKADANNPRGSGVSTGHVDKEVVVNNGKIKMQKNNAGPNANELALSMEGVNMGEDEDGEPISVAYANIKPGRIAVDDAFPDDMPASSKAKLLRGRLLDILRARTAEVGRKPYLRSEVADLVRKEKLVAEGDAGRAELSRAIRDLKGDGVSRIGKGTMEVVFWIDPKGSVQ